MTCQNSVGSAFSQGYGGWTSGGRCKDVQASRPTRNMLQPIIGRTGPQRGQKTDHTGDEKTRPGGGRGHVDGRTGPQGGQEGAAAPAPHQAPVHVSSGQQDTCLSKAPFMDEPGTSHTSLNTSDVHGTAPPWPWATLSFWVPVAHDHVMVDGMTMAPHCQYRLSPGRCRGGDQVPPLHWLLGGPAPHQCHGDGVPCLARSDT